MDSSLTASLLLLSVVFMQFVSAADQNNATIKAEPGDNVILTCKDPDQGKIKIAEWNRTDLRSSEYVLLYKDNQLDPDAQHPSYRDRVDLQLNQLRKGDVSLILKNTTTDDSGTYACRIATEKLKRELISTISLQVSPPPPEPLPVWAIVLLVLLVLLVLAAAAGVSFYFLLRWKRDPEKVEVEPGVESVLLPFKVPRRLWFCKYRLSVDKVEWRDGDNRTVHVNQNGSDQPEEQDEFHRTRTKMDKNLLKTGDLSLTLRRPTDEDENLYSCRVYNRKGDVLMEKDVWLKVKVQQVKVESGVKSVLLPCRTTESLDGDIRVEWRDRDNRKVHVYQNGSDQPGEQNQNQLYKGRTKMDENLKETKDLSLTLSWPTDGDKNTYTCRVYRDGYVLMMKQVLLQVKVHQVEVKSGVESVLLPWTITEDLDGDVRVEWTDSRDKKVHVYQNGSDQPGEQDQRYRTRTRMDENLLKNKNLSLTLRRPTDRDGGKYTCRVYNRKGDVLMKKEIKLEVKVPEVEVESGVESVLLPCRTRESLDGDVRVEWRDKYDRTVHVNQNGSDQPGEQDEFYRTRTRMDENLVRNKDLSLTLSWPRKRDRGFYTCRVSSRDGDVLMEKDVWLKVKVQQVEVEPGEEFVLLPWTITESLDGDVRVEWRDSRDKKVHVYQNGSDQPGEQDQYYKDRTKMDENLLRDKNLSLTLRRLTDGDMNIYTCRVYNRDGVVLMMKQVDLQVKDQQVEVKSGEESVLLPCRTRESLDGDFRVVWRDRGNKKVHVYQNGSDRPREQDQIYRTRTKMDKNLLKNKDLSLILRRPREGDRGIFTCRVYNRDGCILMENLVQLEVKAGTDQDQPEDTRMSLMADQSV